MGEKAVWDDANVKHFIDICKEELGLGNRPNGCFTRKGWKNLEEKFFARSGRKLVKSQLKNKLDNMKKDYTVFMELKIAATGLGWDDANQTVACDNTWWDEHLAVSLVIFFKRIQSVFIVYFPLACSFIFQRCNNPERGVKCIHVKFRKRGLKHLDDLHLLFDKVHVTGASASCPGDLSSGESSDEDVMEMTNNEKPKPAAKKRKQLSSPTEEKEEKSPFFGCTRTHA
jgi:hypothetical protein